MKAIYKPKGKAGEYSEYACNLYKGCGHGCTYCYVPPILRMDRQEFFKNPQPREGIIEALRKDAKKLGKKIYNQGAKKTLELFYDNKIPIHPFVLLCFTCDPYQEPLNQQYHLARQAIEILHENGLGVNILTKGEITDFDLLAKNPHLSKVGVTLTGDHGNYEKYAEHPTDRLYQLELAKTYNIKTWVSMEPVIKPKKCLSYIRKYCQVVDEFKIGKWNYSKEAESIDWHKFTNEAIKLLDDLKCKYYIKEDLRRYIK